MTGCEFHPEAMAELTKAADGLMAQCPCGGSVKIGSKRLASTILHRPKNWLASYT